MKYKKNSGIYSFLEQSGLLEHGSIDEIIAAKKLYWASVRKTWKQERRKECKSYTIFFASKEQRLLENASNKSNCSINFFIKTACMNMLTDRSNINKKIIGKIREILALFYNELECSTENLDHSNAYMKINIIDKFTILENTILSLLHHN